MQRNHLTSVPSVQSRVLQLAQAAKKTNCVHLIRGEDSIMKNNKLLNQSVLNNKVCK